MDYFLFLSILYILPLFTEQNLVVLKPGKHGQWSHEILQLDSNAKLNRPAKNKLTEIKIVPQSSQEEEIQEDIDTEEREELLQLKNTEEVPEEKDEESDPGSIADNQNEMSRLLSEIAAGDYPATSGTNPRIYQPDEYPSFSRRFVPQYHYSERPENVMVALDNKEIIPIQVSFLTDLRQEQKMSSVILQAPLEVVRQVAKQSMLEEAAKPQHDVVVSKALRTGNHWNAVWVEDVDPKSSLRMSNQHILGTIKAKIKPGSEFYDLVSSMTKISPRLLYIINDKQA